VLIPHQLASIVHVRDHETFSLNVFLNYNILTKYVTTTGTGSNMAYLEKLTNVKKWDQDFDEPSQVSEHSIYKYL